MAASEDLFWLGGRCQLLLLRLSRGTGCEVPRAPLPYSWLPCILLFVPDVACIAVMAIAAMMPCPRNRFERPCSFSSSRRPCWSPIPREDGAALDICYPPSTRARSRVVPTGTRASVSMLSLLLSSKTLPPRTYGSCTRQGPLESSRVEQGLLEGSRVELRKESTPERLDEKDTTKQRPKLDWKPPHA